MEENVALDTSKQKKFVKSIKGIKKLIKKTEDVPESVVPKAKDGKKSKRKRPERGLVYLSHIPHGFYEHEMTQYFKQFGAVSNVRVIRSKRTGNSKGFAFVEFKQPAVAEIVAETMNNYLMGKRLIKAACIPPEKQRPKAMRKHWTSRNNPGQMERLKHKKAHNENKTTTGELARARKTLSTYNKNMRKLSDIGINYDFFTPVDIPEELVESKDSQNAVKVDSTSKKNKDTVQKDSKVQKKDKVTEETKKTTKKETIKITEEAKKPAKKDTVKVEQKKEVSKKEKKKVPEAVVNKKEQKDKQQKLKDSGVKLPENFIKVQEDDDSDSSADFDSDDYNKALINDSDVESGDEESDDSDEETEQGSGDEFEITGSDDSEVDESEDEQVIPPKKGKGKAGHIAPPASVSSRKLLKLQAKVLMGKSDVPLTRSKSTSKAQKGEKAKQIDRMQQKGPKAPEPGKRKAPQKNAGSPKKPKFEKQTQQAIKKQFKKKK